MTFFHLGFEQYNFFDDEGRNMMVSYYTQDQADSVCKFGVASGQYPVVAKGAAPEQWKSGNGWNHHVLVR